MSDKEKYLTAMVQFLSDKLQASELECANLYAKWMNEQEKVEGLARNLAMSSG